MSYPLRLLLAIDQLLNVAICNGEEFRAVRDIALNIPKDQR